MTFNIPIIALLIIISCQLHHLNNLWETKLEHFCYQCISPDDSKEWKAYLEVLKYCKEEIKVGKNANN